MFLYVRFLLILAFSSTVLHIGLSLVLQQNRNDQSMEFTWRFGDFHTEQGYKLTDNILRIITVRDYFDCVTACLAEQRCCSVNYKPDDIPNCDLNKRCQRKRVKDGCMKPRTNHVVYYGLSETKERGLLEDPCRTSPCLNGGTCSLTERCNGYNCTCHPHNTGEHCESWKDVAHNNTESAVNPTTVTAAIVRPTSVAAGGGGSSDRRRSSSRRRGRRQAW